MTVRHALNLERTTHRHLIEPLTGSLHPKVMLSSRLVSFYRGLIKSPKFSIRFLARLAERDMRTVLGGTLRYLLQQCSLEDFEFEKLSPTLVKKRMVYARAPLGEEWRNLLAVELLSIRNEELLVEGFSSPELEAMFAYTCTS